MGYVAAGEPIEAVATLESIAVPEMIIGNNRAYVLRVRGDSMIDEQIRDGDYVVVEDRKTAENGEMVIALLNNAEVTLKMLFRENDSVRLQPANRKMEPIIIRAVDLRIQGVVVGIMRRY